MLIYEAGGIRGQAGEDVAPPLLRRLGRALAEIMGDRRMVVVGGDTRPSTPDLKAALIEGLSAGGRIVADVGMVPTPMAEFAGRMLRSDAVAMVTGGHLAPSENGLLLTLGELPVAGDDMERLRGLVQGAELEDLAGGEVESWEEDILGEYLAWLSNAVLPVDNSKPMRVVMDAGNGCLARVAPQALQGRAGVSVEMLFGEVDGGFPGRGPDCSAPGALDALMQKVKDGGAALGVAFDAGGRRVRFVDERGEAVSSDVLAVVLLRHLRAAINGRRVVVDARASASLLDEIKKVGGAAALERDGAAYLTARTVHEDAAFGVGVEGLYAYDALRGGVDGLYTAVRVVEMLRSGTEPLSKLCAGISLGCLVRDVRVACPAEGSRTILNRLRAGFPREVQTEVGGIRVRLDDGWAAALPCEADETIAFSFEGRDRQAVERIATEILNMAPEVREPARRLAGLPEPTPADPYAYLDQDEK